MADYRSEAEKYLSRAFDSDIKVLVWGPGDPGPDGSAEHRAAYAKRVQILDELQRRFPRAEIHFSEAPEMVALTHDVRGQLRKQALQARVSDVIVMLDVGRGVDLELDHFVPTYPWFRSKVHVFLPERFVDSPGLVDQVLSLLPRDSVEGFSAEAFERCDVARTMAVQVVQSVALDRLLRE